MAEERQRRLALQLNDPVTVLVAGKKHHGRVIERQLVRSRYHHTVRHLVLTDVHHGWFLLETGLMEHSQQASLVPGHV